MLPHRVLLASVLVATSAVSLAYQAFVNITQPAAVRIMLVANEAFKHRELLLAGAREAAKKYNVELEILSVSDDSGGLAEIASNVGRLADFDGAVVADDESNSSDLPARVAEVTRTVTVGKGPLVTNHFGHVEAADFQIGRALAYTTLKALPRGGRIALLGNAEKYVSQQNFLDEYKLILHYAALSGEAAYEFVDCDVFPSDEISGYHRALASCHGVDCVVDLTSGRASELAQAAAESFPGQQLKVISLDDSDESLQLVEKGTIHAVIGQDAFACGYHAIYRISLICRSSTMELPARGSGSDGVPPVCIRADNVAEFRAPL
jgi:ABC-type sugar transport system substrate-binding protein